MKTSKSKAVKTILFLVLIELIITIVNISWSFIVQFLYTIYHTIKSLPASPDIEQIIKLIASDPLYLLLLTFSNIAYVIVIYLFVRLLDKKRFKDIGLNREKGSLRLFFIGIAAAIAAIALITVLGIVFGIISFDKYGTSLYSKNTLILGLILGIPTFLLVGLGEEIVYRGYVQSKLMWNMNRTAALLISSLLFTLAHIFTYANPIDFIDIFLAGILMGLMYILTESLYLSIGFHFMWDYLQLCILRLQDFPAYSGPVLFIFKGSREFYLGGIKIGNTMEIPFVIVDALIVIILLLLLKKRKNNHEV